MMISMRCFPAVIGRLDSVEVSRNPNGVVVCAARGPRPRYPRVWKVNKRIGTISKSQKLLRCIKGLSNVKEEIYGALDSFIAWELEFPLITVKKAIRRLEEQREWKRIIQVTKWMLSKGQGRTMGTYTILLNALAEDGRLDEVEELWTKLFTENLESTPRNLFDKMMAIYHHKGMHDKMFEIFADMEELGVQPSVSIVTMMGSAFRQLGMLDKYEKLNRKYPPVKWVYRYIRGKRIKVKSKNKGIYVRSDEQGSSEGEESVEGGDEELEAGEANSEELSVELELGEVVELESNESLEENEISSKDMKVRVEPN